MEKYNYIFLKDKNNDYFLKHIKNRNIKKYYIFHPKSKMFKILRKCKIDSKKLWGDWKKDIANYDFYRKENVFIIGKDDYKDLPKFLNTPYKKIPKKIVDYYDYHNWIKRFYE